MPRTFNLSATVSVTLDGDGNGVASTGPSGTNEVWYPQSTYIAASGGVPTGPEPATCTVYAGNGISSGYQVDATYQVTGAASSMISGQSVFSGQSVAAVFANCNPGATATLVVSGTRTVP